jgi:hypothetical protein
MDICIHNFGDENMPIKLLAEGLRSLKIDALMERLRNRGEGLNMNIHGSTQGRRRRLSGEVERGSRLAIFQNQWHLDFFSRRRIHS